MSTTRISAELRRAVRARAGEMCEYCLIHEEDTFFGLEVDYIIAQKHGGETKLENLCCACLSNRYKGSDIATLDAETRALVRLFDPRLDVWTGHFELEDAVIVGKTKVGEATARLLKLNLEERLLEREVLQSLGRYPANKI